MKPYVLVLALALAACNQGKPRHPPADPMALAPPPPAAEAVGAAAAAPMSAGLAKRPEAAGFFLDHAGAAVDPRSRQPAVTPAGQPAVFDGFGFDAVAKRPAKGVDVVIDGKSWPTTYGVARPDVAQFFKAPDLVKVGFRATLPADALSAGPHVVLVRVVAADGKGYFDSPAVPFSAK